MNRPWPTRRRFWKAAVLVALVAVWWWNPNGAVAAGPEAGHPHPWDRNPASEGLPSRIAVSYADLIDPEAIIRNGQKLAEAAKGSAPRGMVQPFLDPYSALLPYAVTMIYGEDPAPQRPVTDRYPPGSAQPAWAALLRSGRIHVTGDGANRARLFLPGDDPRTAYRGQYSVVRHSMTSLLPSDGSPLEVEVYAYRNDYRKTELSLNLKPYLFRATSFPPDRAALDLAPLEEFFRSGGQLEGAELSPEEGLVLYASEAKAQTLAGQPVNLSDLAVAYRAVFHAGENEAFISLDAHPDPMMSTVNFGGYLEDTRIGAVVLEADKRFKTLSSGLDPDTHQDRRAAARQLVPSFLTSCERGFLNPRAKATEVWEATRFWFYPDSVGVESDPEQRYGVITRAQFTADAERLEESFASAGSSQKRSAVTSDVRESIKHLNSHYTEYASAFPELGELGSVARLMSVCIWLKKTGNAWLDLDALLSVELPAVSTGREITKMIATSFVSTPFDQKPMEDYVLKNAQVFYLTPHLERTVADAFGGTREMAKFLALKKGKDPEGWEAFTEEAGRLYDATRAKRVRELLRTNDDLVALLKYIGREIRFPTPAWAVRGEAELAADRERMEALKAEVAALQEKAAASSGPDAGRYGIMTAQREAELFAVKRKHHDKTSLTRYQVKAVIEITGGINLRPGSFTVKETPASPALDRFREVARKAGTQWKPVGSTKWIRSRGSATGGGAMVAKISKPMPAAAPQKPPAPSTSSGAGAAVGRVSGTPTARTAPVAAPSKAPPGGTASPSPQKAAPLPVQVEKDELPARKQPLLAALPKLRISAAAGGKMGDVTGEVTSDGRIVFSRAAR